jgi:hypothetical protein
MCSRKTFTQLIAAAALLSASAFSHASLVYVGPVPATGSGFGHVETVLTLQSNNMTGTSSGLVGRAAGADFTVGTVQPGSVHNSTYSFSELGITDADDLLFIFNPAEPGNANNSIQLDSLILSIYSDFGGPALFTASLDSPHFFPTTNPGIGNSGFGFALDAAQALSAQAFVSATNRIGLAATVTSATGGPDTFFVNVLDGSNPVPEPGSVALLGVAVIGMWAVRRRRGQG